MASFLFPTYQSLLDNLTNQFYLVQNPLNDAEIIHSTHPFYIHSSPIRAKVIFLQEENGRESQLLS